MLCSPHPEDVVYDCGLLTDESLDIVDKLVGESGILEQLEKMGVKIPELKNQQDMHCTFRYMAGAQNQSKRDYQLSNNELHKEGALCVNGIGAYVKDGVLMNLGLLVDEGKSMHEEAFCSIRKGLFSNDISHITVAINRTEVDGKRVTSAAYTQKCFMNFGQDPQLGEFAYSMKFEPVMLNCTAEAMCGKTKVDELASYPEARRQREMGMEQDVGGR